MHAFGLTTRSGIGPFDGIIEQVRIACARRNSFHDRLVVAERPRLKTYPAAIGLMQMNLYSSHERSPNAK
jgi:hypothetical protein